MPSSVPADIIEIERAVMRIAHMLTRARRHDRFIAAAGVAVDRAGVPLLRVLADEGGPLRPGEIAVRLAVEAPQVTRQVQRLERAGYVERVPDPDDGRARRIQLTDAGLEALESVRAAGREWMREALGAWTPAERERLAGLVHRMMDDFEAHMDRSDAEGLPDPATAAGR
ncbi:MarR family winged helix-turn-helix transcriptional regulator [Actinomadura roseirufa]|uniref:MarR family winged helix-turn-helix transcriptional regulator n=1 Tax=Actinomadura roseirufa TaxID=2094049 RepID=UPI001A95492A|nr:MarR family transcriptional regulator [Actinomadura roseirufa]